MREFIECFLISMAILASPFAFVALVFGLATLVIFAMAGITQFIDRLRK